MSAQDQIKQWLIKGHGITPLTALYKFGHSRLASVINRLRNQGYNIETKIESVDGKRFARYRLIK